MDSDDEDKQLEDKELYKEVPNGSSVLGNTMIKALEKICLRGDLFSDIVNYFFFVEDPKFARFYLLPKIISIYTMYLVDQ